MSESKPITIIRKDEASPEPLTNRIIKWNKRFFARRSLQKALEGVRLPGLTLDLGSSAGPYRHLCEKRVSFDLLPYEVDVAGDAHWLPFRSESFDSLLCTEVLEHLVRPEKAVREMRRVLKPDGLLVLSTRFIFPIHDAPGDYYRFTRFGLEWLFRDWSIERITPTDRSFETLNIAYNRLVYEKEIGKLLRAAILLRTLMAAPVARLLSKAINSETMASGYVLVARKRTP